MAHPRYYTYYMPKVIMGIGAPGSGKTTVLKKFAEKYKYVYVCPDDLRAKIARDAADQSKNAEVWDAARRDTTQALARGETVVFDATFAYPRGRKEFIAFARANGADAVQGLFVATSLGVAEERNALRERRVPEEVVKRMHGSLRDEPPSVLDGFDSVFTLNERHELVRTEHVQGEDGVHMREHLPKLR